MTEQLICFLEQTQSTLKYLDNAMIHSASCYGPRGMRAVTVNKSMLMTDLPGWMKVFKMRSLLILERMNIVYFIYICLDRCWPSGFLQSSYAKGFAPVTMLCSLSSIYTQNTLLLLFNGCRLRTNHISVVMRVVSLCCREPNKLY